MHILHTVTKFAVTSLVVAVALVAGHQLWIGYTEVPWTRDARVRADVVSVSADVSGLVSEVSVRENQQVTKGQVLFRVDPVRFELALKLAEANVESKQAIYEEAEHDKQRALALTNLSVSEQTREQRISAATQAEAAYKQALADRDVARLNLARSEVVATVDGLVTNFGLRPGTYVEAGKAVFAVIDTNTYHVDAYFEETKLDHMKIGDMAEVRLMGSNSILRGRLLSIAGGVEDRERTNGESLLANVNPVFSWVRLAQRVPVRIEFCDVNARRGLIAGRTVTVEIVPDTLKSSDKSECEHESPAIAEMPRFAMPNTESSVVRWANAPPGNQVSK